MTSEDLKSIRKLNYPRLILFINALLKGGVTLANIEVNDWVNNTKPGVYVRKFGSNKTKRYCRCSWGDLDEAIKFYDKEVYAQFVAEKPEAKNTWVNDFIC